MGWWKYSFAAGLCLTIGCDSGDDPLVTLALVEAEMWEPAEPASDVFADLRPADAACDPDLGYGPEFLGGEPSFEINTGPCNFLTLQQPLVEAIGEGDLLEVRLWHFELFSLDQPAEAYAALALGGEVVWEERIPIPSPSSMVVGTVSAPADFDPGTDVQFHLNNHGINSWDLLTVTATH